MKFSYTKTNTGAMEYRAHTTLDGAPFLYWCQVDDEKRWPADHELMIEGRRFIIGYMDDEGDEPGAAILASDIEPRTLAALMFAMSQEFDTNVLSHSI